MSFRSFDATENTAVFRAVLEFIWRPEGGLYLYGAVGVGKTHLAAAVASHLSWRLLTVQFISLADCLSELRKKVRGEHQELDIHRLCDDADVLVLDDVGAENDLTPWGQEQVWTIADRRWVLERPLVVTTNLDPEELERKIGKRAVSRIMGACGGKVLKLKGRDRRIDPR